MKCNRGNCPSWNDSTCEHDDDDSWLFQPNTQPCEDYEAAYVEEYGQEMPL